MNKILITLLAISLLSPLSGVQTVIDSEQKNTVKEFELSDLQRSPWSNVKSEWMKLDYSACLKKFKLKMNCDGCSYIYMKAVITINREGRLSGYKKTGEDVCGKKISPELEKCFMEPLKKQIFPEVLKGTEFEVMLGTGLKC